MIEYDNFDITIAPDLTGVGRSVSVTYSLTGEALEPFRLSLSALELENFLLKLGARRQGFRRKEAPDQTITKGFGKRLFADLFVGQVGSRFASSCALARERGRGTRIRLRLVGVPELTNVPWEYLFDPSGSDFIVASKYSPLVRYLEVPQPNTALLVAGPLRVVVGIASPSNLPELSAVRESELLRSALEEPIQQGRIVLEVLSHLSLAGLAKRLEDLRSAVHVLHFICHGYYDTKSDEAGLELEPYIRPGLVRGLEQLPPPRNAVSADADQIARVLSDHRSLRLVVLNSCDGARDSIEHPMTGVTQTLIRRGIPAVVAMQFEVSDKAACTFSEAFYESLAKGLPVDGALGAARMRLLNEENYIEWATPALYLRAFDGRLFDINQKSVREVEPVTAKLTAKGISEVSTQATGLSRHAIEMVIALGILVCLGILAWLLFGRFVSTPN